MSNKYLFLVLCVLFLSCKKKENEIKTFDFKEDKTELKELSKVVEEFKPIFIGLSPKMTNEAFKKKIEQFLPVFF